MDLPPKSGERLRLEMSDIERTYWIKTTLVFGDAFNTTEVPFCNHKISLGRYKDDVAKLKYWKYIEEVLHEKETPTMGQ